FAVATLALVAAAGAWAAVRGGDAGARRGRRGVGGAPPALTTLLAKAPQAPLA
ncbi:hypothetical protein H7I01_07660, partial [Mycobacterium palustre]|nr:hypothetical protein [Mycobacterium palustre]